ncbi:hypothetical protein, partial [Escherichia coli]|uniref:hypothetical protein n=1 Tax=Escherichia coli TaxID=562 RepID=UPI0028740FC7
MSVGSTHHLEMVFVWKQNYILVDEYFFFCCTWIVNSARKKQPHPFIRKLMRALATLILTLHTSLLITQHLPFCNTLED